MNKRYEKKINCWEFMRCGREPGGSNAGERGICPAADNPVFHGYNQGVNAGRICWLVAGTFCKGQVQGSFAEKRNSCRNCEFYKLSNREQGITCLTDEEYDLFAITHVGLVRNRNEDRYFLKRFTDGSLLLAVADGLGGEAAGDYAAELLRAKLVGVDSIALGNEQQQLAQLVLEIDQTILAEAEENPTLEGMGTTLVCVLVRNGRAFWVHVGDSRLYQLHDGVLRQITKDQNFARFLVEEGDISPEEAMNHDGRFHLDQCIGQGFLEPEIGTFPIVGDTLLMLATDGLHTLVPHGEIEEILCRSAPMEGKAMALINRALEMGGEDNITLILAGVPGPAGTIAGY